MKSRLPLGRLSLPLAALLAACHPGPVREDRRGTAPEKPAEGAALYYVYDGHVRRADCGDKAPDTAKAIAAQCKDRPGAGEPPTVAAFEASLTAAYQQRVGDDQVNDREARSIRQMIDALPGASDGTALTDGAGAANPLAALVEARVAALFDAAFERTNAALSPADGDGDDGLRLADAPAYELARGRVDPAKVAVGTVTYSIALNATSAVSTLTVRVQAAAGAACPLSLGALTRAWVRRNNADTEILVAPLVAKPGTYTINGGTAVQPVRAYVSVRRAAATPVAGSCLIVVEGKAPATAPPPADTPRDAKMKAMMGMRSHRLYHFLWHGIRNAWPEMAASERKQIRDRLGSAWAREDAETKTRVQPNKGEEFLHMHRGMVLAVKALLGTDMYGAWTAPPAPDSAEFPLPNGRNAASDQEYADTILPLHNRAVDPVFLRSRSLGDYGVWLETGLHNALHNRFADARKSLLEQMTGIFQTPLATWDVPNADYLGSTYSAHVNPIFYRLHGYVDARIDDWARANGFDKVAEACAGVPRCYQWKRLWDGPVPDHHAGLALAAGAEQFGALPKALQRLVQESSTFVFQAP